MDLRKIHDDRTTEHARIINRAKTHTVFLPGARDITPLNNQRARK